MDDKGNNTNEYKNIFVARKKYSLETICGFFTDKYIFSRIQNFWGDSWRFTFRSEGYKVAVFPSFQGYCLETRYSNLRIVTPGYSSKWTLSLGDWRLFASFGEIIVDNIKTKEEIYLNPKWTKEKQIIKEPVSPKKESIIIEERDNILLNHKKLYERVRNKSECLQDWQDYSTTITDKDILFEEAEGFLEYYIKKEDFEKYLQTTITLNKIKEDALQIIPLDDVTLKELIDNEIADYIVECDENREFEEDIDFQEKSQTIVERILQMIEEKIKDNSILKLKKIWPFEKVELAFENELKQMTYIDHARYYLWEFVNNDCSTTEQELFKNIKKFLKFYKNYETNHINFIEKHNGNKYFINLTDDKEKRFSFQTQNTTEFTNEEIEEYKLYCSLYELFYSIIYIKNSSRIKPTFQNLSQYLEYIKWLINFLINKGLLIQKGDNFLLGDLSKVVFLDEGIPGYQNYLELVKK